MGIGCSDKEDPEETVSGLVVKVYADVMDVFHHTDGTIERDYAYWDTSPYDENIQVIMIHLGSRDEFGMLHNLPDDISSWFENGYPVTVKIDGVIKPGYKGYILVGLTKSIDLYVSSIYKLDNL